MKYFTGLVNKTLNDGTHAFTEIKYLIKRKKTTFAGEVGWEYTIKEGYAYTLEDTVHNKPTHIFCAGTYVDAIHLAFDRNLGWMDGIKLEHLAEVTL